MRNLKRALIFVPSAVGCAVFAAASKYKARHPRLADATGISRVPPTQRGALMNFMLIGVLPLWILSGAADYLWHRHTRIETTSGVRESISHNLMMLESGPLVLAALFLEINAGAIALMTVCFLVHEATVIWDLRFAAGRRLTPPGEQQVHSCLEVLPFCIVWLACCVHWPRALALLGLGPEPPRFSLRLRQPTLPPKYIATIFGSLASFVVAPHGEELWRCWQVARQGLEGRDTPDCIRTIYGELQPAVK